MLVRMWEARAHPAGFDELLVWVREVAVPRLETSVGHLHSEVFQAVDHRIVVISRWDGDPATVPEPPAGLVARAPHAWDFTPVPR